MSERFSRGWMLLLGLDRGARVLEVSADSGERAQALAAAGFEPLCLRATPAEAGALGGHGLAALSLEDAARLPAASVDGAVLALAVGRTVAAEWPDAAPEALVRLLLPALKPGAPCVLALPNPLLALPIVDRLVDRLRSEPASDRPQPRGSSRPRLLGAAALGRSLERAGLTEVRVFAALPSAHQLKFLVPLGDRAVIDYFFRHLLPRARGSGRRLALRLAAAAAGRGLFERIVPAYEVSARKAAT